MPGFDEPRPGLYPARVNLTDWLSTAIAALALLVSVWAVRESRRATNSVEASEKRRGQGRLAIGVVIAAGDGLLDEARRLSRRLNQDREAGVERDLAQQIAAWDEQAHVVIREVDAAQESRYDAILPESRRAEAILEERLRRLQEIQDRL